MHSLEAHFCEPCNCYTDDCLVHHPGPCDCTGVLPACDCRWLDADYADVRGCELHDPRSAFNRADEPVVMPMASIEEPETLYWTPADDDTPWSAVPRKPVGNEHVAEPFRSILNSITGGR